MKSNATFEGVRLFGVKPLGNGCRFGIKVNSKKQDNTYTKGVFINCKHNQMLEEGVNYTINGFFGDNEYNGNNTLEFIVMSAIPEYSQQQSAQQHSKPYTPQHKQPKSQAENNYQGDGFPSIDIDESEIPF